MNEMNFENFYKSNIEVLSKYPKDDLFTIYYVLKKMDSKLNKLFLSYMKSKCSDDLRTEEMLELEISEIYESEMLILGAMKQFLNKYDVMKIDIRWFPDFFIALSNAIKKEYLDLETILESEIERIMVELNKDRELYVAVINNQIIENIDLDKGIKYTISNDTFHLITVPEGTFFIPAYQFFFTKEEAINFLIRQNQNNPIDPNSTLFRLNDLGKDQIIPEHVLEKLADNFSFQPKNVFEPIPIRSRSKAMSICTPESMVLVEKIYDSVLSNLEYVKDNLPVDSFETSGLRQLLEDIQK